MLLLHCPVHTHCLSHHGGWVSSVGWQQQGVGLLGQVAEGLRGVCKRVCGVVCWGVMSGKMCRVEQFLATEQGYTGSCWNNDKHGQTHSRMAGILRVKQALTSTYCSATLSCAAAVPPPVVSSCANILRPAAVACCRLLLLQKGRTGQQRGTRSQQHVRFVCVCVCMRMLQP